MSDSLAALRDVVVRMIENEYIKMMLKIKAIPEKEVKG